MQKLSYAAEEIIRGGKCYYKACGNEVTAHRTSNQWRKTAMINDAAAVALLMKALGYGVPAATMTFMFLVFMFFLRFQKAKGDKDRREHMEKWESLIETNRESVASQKDSTESLIRTHESEISRIIDHHKDEIDRMFCLHERQTKCFEALAHNLTVITEKIEAREFCPMAGKE
jgi:uncharacterized membrane protein YhiD involved in acid resistance